MSRPTSCQLSTANLLHNLSVVKIKAPRAKILAMVKANGFGHGLRSVAQKLDEHVDALGVASIDEALALRQANVKAPIVLMEGAFTPDDLSQAATHDFAVVFHSQDQLRWLIEQPLPQLISAWVKVDTGMGRLGFSLREAKAALDLLARAPLVRQPLGLMSHLACADEPSHAMNARQFANFDAVARNHSGPKSLCNSAALFAFPDRHYDCVRPGLALYGASPLAGVAAEALDLKPVMTFQTRVIATHKLSRGAPVGYGATAQCPEDMPIAIIAAGYGDGYPRNAPTGTPVLIEGIPCPIIGRVAMDMTAVDLRQRPETAIDDKVILWGDGLPVETVAAASGQSPYDLLCAVQNRVKFEWC